MPRILITGVAGHIGSRLAAYILKQNPRTEIVGVDDLSCGYVQNVPIGVEYFAGDAADPAVVNDNGPFDYVFHLAAYAAECMSPFVRRYNYRNNLVTTAGLVSNLIDAGFEGRLVFTSSMAAYGNANGAPPPFDERMPCTPHDPYGIAKLAAEQDIRIAGAQHGLEWCVIRPHNVYGPFQSIWQKHRNVLGLWMRAALEEQPITIFGDGEQLRAFSFIDDTVAAIWQAAIRGAAEGQVINVGGREAITINELAGVFRSVVAQVRIKREPPRHEVRRAYCTSRRSEELLDYCDAASLTDGIGLMWHWAQKAWRDYPERRAKEPAFEVETFEGMPPLWRSDFLSEKPAHAS